MKNYAVVGRSLEHSFSPEYFAKKFAKQHISDAVYGRIELASDDDLRELVQKAHLDGFNVTIPYKESILSFLDACDPTALTIGSVNCVLRKEGRYIGYNCDHVGFRKTLRPMVANRSIRALVLGSGGASKAVTYVLHEMNIPFLVVSRNPGKDLTYAEVDESHLSSHKLIINCTPLGTWPNVFDKPDIPYHALSYRNILYDLTYNPGITAFLKEGMSKGATVRNGKEMLRIQAEESWKIWQS